MTTCRSNMGQVSKTMQRALLITKRDGRLLFDGATWRGERSGEEVAAHTVYALFDRYLILVCFGGDKRRLRHSAKLTPTGWMVVSTLRDQLPRIVAHGISEEAARFIQQVTA